MALDLASHCSARAAAVVEAPAEAVAAEAPEPVSEASAAVDGVDVPVVAPTPVTEPRRRAHAA
jgi:D-alanyl-D-alanine dipeptidase